MSEFFAATLGARQPENALAWSTLFAPDAARTAEGWTIAEAFAAILFAAATCDGEVAAVEQEELLALVHRSRALKAYTPAQLAQINGKIVARLRDEPNALRDACSALQEDMRLPIFAHALDLILADGELNTDEADFLNTLILNLKLNREDVSKIADVIVLKNSY